MFIYLEIRAKHGRNGKTKEILQNCSPLPLSALGKEVELSLQETIFKLPIITLSYDMKTFDDTSESCCGILCHFIGAIF